jgi:hypothetical protein
MMSRKNYRRAVVQLLREYGQDPTGKELKRAVRVFEWFFAEDNSNFNMETFEQEILKRFQATKPKLNGGLPAWDAKLPS